MSCNVLVIRIHLERQRSRCLATHVSIMVMARSEGCKSQRIAGTWPSTCIPRGFAPSCISLVLRAAAPNSGPHWYGWPGPSCRAWMRGEAMEDRARQRRAERARNVRDMTRGATALLGIGILGLSFILCLLVFLFLVYLASNSFDVEMVDISARRSERKQAPL